MDIFRCDSACEAVDADGHWERATVIDVWEGDSPGFTVTFDGWGNRLNRWVSLEEIRPRTEIVEGN